MNKVWLIGNLTKDPELSTTGSGISVCKFTLAVTRRFAQNETDFFNIIVWRGPAENCFKFLKKGGRAAVNGSIQNRSYEDNNGNKRYVTEIIADEVQFLSTRNEDGSSQVSAQGATPSGLVPVDEDVPF